MPRLYPQKSIRKTSTNAVLSSERATLKIKDVQNDIASLSDYYNTIIVDEKFCALHIIRL